MRTFKVKDKDQLKPALKRVEQATSGMDYQTELAVLVMRVATICLDQGLAGRSFGDQVEEIISCQKDTQRLESVSDS